MKKAAIVVGHSQTSQGAVNPETGKTEWQFNNEIAQMVKDKLLPHPSIHPIIVYRNHGYAKLPYEINELQPDAILSLHANAFNRYASGCEVLYYHKSERGKKFAEIVLRNIHSVLFNTNRGIRPKTSEDRGGYLLKLTNAPCVIAEPFFIDNYEDFMKAEHSKGALADAYAKSIIEFLTQG